ncbi:MAG: hypothetical protein ABSA97_01000 [Verrucomicrobiia bacterium]
MNARKPNQQSDFAGHRVLILCGQHQGQEGICIGRSTDGKRWAISPDGTNEILQLVFEREFGLVLDISGRLQN